MTTEEHLNRIVAKCRELLEEKAAKRTPGKWSHYSDRVCSESEFHDDAEVDNVDVCQGITWRKDSPKQKVGENLVFIAACAGSAEAGWRATIAAIEAIRSAPHDRYCSAVKGPEPETWLVESDCDCWKKDAVASIIAAWPEELL